MEQIIGENEVLNRENYRFYWKIREQDDFLKLPHLQPPTNQLHLGRTGGAREIALKSRLKSSRKFWGSKVKTRPNRCFLQSFASRAL